MPLVFEAEACISKHQFPAEHKTNSLHEGCIKCSLIFNKKTFFPSTIIFMNGEN